MSKVFVFFTLGIMVSIPSAFGTAWVEPRVKEAIRKQEKQSDAEHYSPKVEEMVRANRRKLGCSDADKTAFCTDSPGAKSNAKSSEKPRSEILPTEPEDSNAVSR